MVALSPKTHGQWLDTLHNHTTIRLISLHSHSFSSSPFPLFFTIFVSRVASELKATSGELRLNRTQSKPDDGLCQFTGLWFVLRYWSLLWHESWRSRRRVIFLKKLNNTFFNDISYFICFGLPVMRSASISTLCTRLYRNRFGTDTNADHLQWRINHQRILADTKSL